MFFLKMAFRNLFRQFRRNILSIVSIVLGIFFFVAGRGFVSGMTENTIRAQIDTAVGHLTTVPKEYPEIGARHPVDELYTLDNETRAWFDKESIAWTTRVLASPRAIKGRDSIRVRLVGYDEKKDESVFSRKQWVLEGELADGKENAVMVGIGIAKLLELTIGDTVVLENRTAQGALNAMRFSVSGILNTRNQAVDSVAMFTTQKNIRELINSGDAVSHVSFLLKDRDDSTAFKQKLNDRMGTVADVRTWQEEAAPMVSAGQMRETMLSFIVGALLLMAAAGIANTILMATYERIREIGTLRAMGLSRSGVVAMFTIEGVVLGAFGALIGGVLGAWLTSHYAAVGIDLTSMIEGRDLKGVPMSAMLYMSFSPKLIISVVFGAIGVAAVSSVYPAVIASRLLPADAVRAA